MNQLNTTPVASTIPDASSPASTQTRTERLLVLGLMAGALLLTFLRGMRLPNPWAQAHWLLTYGNGFIKRGLIGTVMDLVGFYNSPATAQLVIFAASFLILGLLCAVLVMLCRRLLYLTHDAAWTALLVILFMSSPFIVMSAHLVGYFDHIFEIATLPVVVLLLRKRGAAAGILQVILVLIHESYVLVGFPVAIFAVFLLLVKEQRRPRAAEIFALAAPVLVFIFILVHQSMLDKRLLYDALMTRLNNFPFVDEFFGRHMVADAFTTTFQSYFSNPLVQFTTRITDPAMMTMVFPMLIFALYYLWRSFRDSLRGWHIIVAAGVMLVPLLMHIIAWDYSRIWMYPIFHALLVVWVCAELFPACVPDSSTAAVILFIVAFAVHVLCEVPLMDGFSDTLSGERILYLLVLWFMAGSPRIRAFVRHSLRLKSASA